MRTLTLILLTCGFLGSLASAASGVRIHRLGDPPLPPRFMEVKQPASRGFFSFFRRSPRTTTAAPARRSVPIASDRTPVEPKPVLLAPKPTTPPIAAAPRQPRPTVLPISPPRAAEPLPPAPTVSSRPQPRTTVLPIATKPVVAKTPVVSSPVVEAAPANTLNPGKPAVGLKSPAVVKATPAAVTVSTTPRREVKPASPEPVARPAAEQQPAAPRSNRPRRRLPIAPI